MVTTLEDAGGSRTLAVGATIRAFLDKHPDLAHHPTQIAEALGVPIGSAKSFSKSRRESQKPSRRGPILLQNLRFFTRTPQVRPPRVRPRRAGRIAATTSSRAPSTSRPMATWTCAGPRTEGRRSRWPLPGA
jgi:hypothetical protein